MKGFFNVNVKVGREIGILGETYSNPWVTVMQHKDVSSALNLLKTENNPERIIEIGTAYGGFTYLLTQTFPDAKVYSFDVETRDGVIALAFDLDFYYFKEDITSTDALSRLVPKEGQTIVFCDGGNKLKEFNKVAPMLKKGDIILVHDYSITMDYFEKEINGKIWDWCEITGEQLVDTIETYGLTPYMQDEFQSVVWGCFIKE